MTSYIDQLSSDPALQQNLNSLNSQQAAIVNSYSAPVIQYISLENQTLNLLNNELVKFDAVRSCLDSKLTMKPTNVSQAQVDTFDRIEQQQIIASITLTQESIDNASSTLDQIHVVANKVQNSATVIDLSNTSTEYGQQIAALSNSVDPAAAQDDLTAVTARMKTLDSTLATYQNLCNNNYY